MPGHDSTRLALKPRLDGQPPDGAWWPRSRTLALELPALFSAWPIDAGCIVRVTYAAADWDDAPRAVQVSNRRGWLKTSGLPPAAQPHRIELAMLSGRAWTLAVVSPTATQTMALRDLGRFAPVGRARWTFPPDVRA